MLSASGSVACSPQQRRVPDSSARSLFAHSCAIISTCPAPELSCQIWLRISTCCSADTTQAALWACRLLSGTASASVHYGSGLASADASVEAKFLKKTAGDDFMQDIRCGDLNDSA